MPSPFGIPWMGYQSGAYGGWSFNMAQSWAPKPGYTQTGLGIGTTFTPTGNAPWQPGLQNMADQGGQAWSQNVVTQSSEQAAAQTTDPYAYGYQQPRIASQSTRSQLEVPIQYAETSGSRRPGQVYTGGVAGYSGSGGWTPVETQHGPLGTAASYIQSLIVGGLGIPGPGVEGYSGGGSMDTDFPSPIPSSYHGGTYYYDDDFGPWTDYYEYS